MSRNEAKRSILVKTFKKSMKDVISSSVNKQTLDEAPQAYKDYNMIMEVIDGRLNSMLIVSILHID